MILKFLKTYKILLFILILFITAAIIFLTNNSQEVEKLNTTETEVPKQQKIIESKKQNTPVEKNVHKISQDKAPIDFIGQNDFSTDLKPTIEQIMKEQSKINTFSKDKKLTQKKDWNVEYEVGLEDGAIEDLKSDPSLKTQMLNGKVGFSKSF